MWAFSDPTPRSTEHSLSLNREWFISSISCYSLFRWLVGVWMRTDVSHFWPVHLLTRTFTSTRVVFFNAITASFFFVLLCFTATSFLCKNRLYRIISALSWTLSSTNRASTSVEDEMWPHLAVGPQITFSRSLPLHWLIDRLTEWLPQLLYLLYTIKEVTLNRKQCIVDV